MDFLKKIRPLLFFAACIGFLLSVLVHLSSFEPLAFLQLPDSVPVFGLHVLVFFFFIPGFFILRKEMADRDMDSRDDISAVQLWKTRPKWLLIPFFVLMPYVMFNFFSATSQLESRGYRDAKTGKYYIANRTRSREVSVEQFHRYKNLEHRAFSGHWLIFYWASIVMLYPFIRKAAITTRNDSQSVDIPVFVDTFPIEASPFPGRIWQNKYLLLSYSLALLPVIIVAILKIYVFLVIILIVLIFNTYSLLKYYKIHINQLETWDDRLIIYYDSFQEETRLSIEVSEFRLILRRLARKNGYTYQLEFFNKEETVLVQNSGNGYWSKEKLISLFEFLQQKYPDVSMRRLP